MPAAGSVPASVVCPLTLEEVRHGVVLRGVTMEIAAVLALLASGAPWRHPYDRSPLTPAEILDVHLAALRVAETRAELVRLGWLGGIPYRTEAAAPGELRFELQPANRCERLILNGARFVVCAFSAFVLFVAADALTERWTGGLLWGER
jgi:hypothetical protein